MRVALFLCALALLAPAPPAQDAPLVIAHRGASGHRPEHTIEAYRLAVEMGADYIEPDLVTTKDGILIARHENEIGATTDVADRFPDRKRTKPVDGRTVTGWFSEDFTLAEIRTLRARERLPFRSRAYDGRFQVPTFDDVIQLAQSLSKTHRRIIGVYPETKHPGYFRKLGTPLEEKLVASLQKHGWNGHDAPVFIQSFEDNLRDLRKLTGVRLIQLLEASADTDDAVLARIASYADGIGAEKRLVQPVAADGSLAPATDLVWRAHEHGLQVHVWTLRADKEFLPAAYKGDARAEVLRFRMLGVDGMFTDFPDVAVEALKTAK